jgi:D-3-phosphoglycerate dehydrogenase
MKFLILDKIHHAFHDYILARGHSIEEDFACLGVDLMKKSAAYEGIIVRNRVILDKNYLDQNRHLKVIGRCGSGLENIDVQHAHSLGIAVVNSPEGNANAVGEHATAMLLALANNIVRGDGEVRKAQWNRELNRGWELEGRCVGIIGYGNTGKAFAEKLQGFGCRILAHDKYISVEPTELVQSASFDEVLSQCDVISLHLPLTDETRFMVNENFLAKTRHGFVLINTSRGPIVKISAILAALKSGKMLGACLDVLEYEKHTMEIDNLPEEFKTLKALSNVVLSPHVAGLTAESLVKLSEILAHKVVAAIQ